MFQNQWDNLESELEKIIQPPPPTFRDIPKAPDKGLYEPSLSLVDKILKSRKDKKIRQTEIQYEEATNTWKKSVDEINSFNFNLQEQYEKDLKEFETQRQAVSQHYDALDKKWAMERESFYKNKMKHNDKIDRLKGIYPQRNREAVIQYCEMVLNNSEYPETFPKDFDLDYDPDRKLLIAEYILPSPDDVPRLTNVRYIATKKEFKESHPFGDTIYEDLRIHNLQNNSQNIVRTISSRQNRSLKINYFKWLG